MKVKVILSIILFCGIQASATDRYIALSGNDGAAGTIVAPWKTIAKLNSSFITFVAGDRVFFNRGDSFYGAIRPTKSFASGNPLIIGAYGTGADPVITGFIDVVAWTNLGGNIWESTVPPSTLTSCNMVVVNGVNYAMGRFPNTGWLTYQSFTQTTLTSSSLNSATTNWTGAKVVIRKNNWITEIDTVLSHSGSTLVHTFHGTTNGAVNYGFFLENDLRTLDVQNEWYYSSSSKKIRIYSTTMPTNVKVSTIDTLVYTHQFDYITFQNLKFTGSNKYCFEIAGSRDITIQDNTMDFHGRDLIWGYHNFGASSAINLIFRRNTVNHINSNGITYATEFINAYIGYNTFKNIGLQPGMAQDGSDPSNGTCEALQLKSAGATIEWNRFDSIGYIAIQTLANNNTIRFNFIQHIAMTKQDGGGIYTWNGIIGAAAYLGNKAYNNILLNSSGATSVPGTTQTLTNSLVHGIYLDANTRNWELYNNTVSGFGYGGGYNYSGSSKNNWHHNTFYNNGVNQMLLIDQRTPSTGSIATTADTLFGNIFFSKTAGQLTAKFTTAVAAGTFFSGVGFFDSNYYCRPISDFLTIQLIPPTGGSAYTLTPGWKTVSGKDVHSQASPISGIADTSMLKFVYNDSSAAKTFTLGAIYVDARNVTYNNTITLQPFTSAVLIYSSALINAPPVAVAGPDQIIIANNTTLDGTGSFDSDGFITGYHWTQLSGPFGAIIVLPNNATTTVVSMTPGNYVFQLTVTDNNGATGSDNMQVILNVIPTVGAGVDQTITLPTSSITFAGTASDADGTIASTVWSQLSGPATATITTPSSLTSTVTGLVAGTYVFILTATDNHGAVNSDTMTVTVNGAPANIPPVSNAGADSTIQLPRDSVHLLGHGTDADGTIVGYQWFLVSGPNTPTISTPTDSNTVILGMIAGIYKFRLRVIDNQGSLASDTVQVTVNPASNVPPTANAGVDQAVNVDHSTLLGSGNDTDGTIVSYSWAQLSGPNTATIAFPSNAITAVGNLITGTYVFELTVTDNDGGTDTDTVTIVVSVMDSKLLFIHGNIIFEKE